MTNISRLGLIGMLALSVSARAQDEDLHTARAKLDSVELAAQAIAADAQLVFVFSPVDMDSTGRSFHWAYVFKSESEARLFEVDYASGSFVVPPEVTVSDPLVHVGLDGLPETWVDSDVALATANRTGGRNFIATHPEHIIGARLYARGRPDGDGPHSYYILPSWQVTYEGPQDQMERLLNAGTGGVRGPYRIDWYIDLLTTAARSVAPDAELKLIVGQEISPNGRTMKWLATYESEEYENLYEFRLDEYRLNQQADLTFGDPQEIRAMPPLPDAWVSSAEAMAVAEQNGGSAFRQSHPGWRCAAHLWTRDVVVRFGGREIPFPGLPIWQVVYNASDSATLDVQVDASSGMFLEDLFEELSPATAAEGLAAADSTVARDSLDAALVFVEAFVPDDAGKAPVWNYVYRSVEGAYAAYLSLGGAGQRVLRFTGYPGFGHALPALPSGWIDSDSAAAVAEEVVGADFRSQYDPVEMEMRLYVTGEFAPVERPAWKVTYAGPGGAWSETAIDAEYGLAYDQLPRVGPRDGLERILSMAEQVDPTARLAQVATGRVMLDGTARRWQYRFKSTRSDTLAEFYNWRGILYQETYPGNLMVDPNAVVLPPGWIDADSALVRAEAQGGTEFREDHPDWRISMALSANSTGFQKASVGSRATWNVTYFDPEGATEHIPIEAAYYAVLSTAGAKFVGVETQAHQLADDIELISVLAFDVDLDGTHETWFYIYQSQVLQELFQFVVQDGVASLSDVVAVADGSVYLGAPPLPVRWADSDLAVSMAEESGGSAFRSDHPNSTIHARLFTPPGEASRWEIRYEVPGQSQTFTVDALTNVGAEDGDPPSEAAFRIEPNYPNPFSGRTRIGYAVAREAQVAIDVVDLMGRRVALLVDGSQRPGRHFVDWDAAELAPGFYVSRLQVDGTVRALSTMLVLR